MRCAHVHRIGLILQGLGVFNDGLYEHIVEVRSAGRSDMQRQSEERSDGGWADWVEPSANMSWILPQLQRGARSGARSSSSVTAAPT